MGGANLVGGANSRGGYVSKNLYIKMKESGPLGGVRRRRPWIRQCTVHVFLCQHAENIVCFLVTLPQLYMMAAKWFGACIFLVFQTKDQKPQMFQWQHARETH